MARQPVAGNARTDAPVSTVQSVTAVNAEVTLLAANSQRFGGMIENASDKVCYLKFGSGASATSYTYALDPMNANGVGGKVNLADSFRNYTGIITAFWPAGPTGAARVTELSE